MWQNLLRWDRPPPPQGRWVCHSLWCAAEKVHAWDYLIQLLIKLISLYMYCFDRTPYTCLVQYSTKLIILFGGSIEPACSSFAIKKGEDLQYVRYCNSFFLFNIHCKWQVLYRMYRYLLYYVTVCVCRSLNTVKISKVKYVVWSDDMSHVALLGRNSTS